MSDQSHNTQFGEHHSFATECTLDPKNFGPPDLQYQTSHFQSCDLAEWTPAPTTESNSPILSDFMLSPDFFNIDLPTPDFFHQASVLNPNAYFTTPIAGLEFSIESHSLDNSGYPRVYPTQEYQRIFSHGPEVLIQLQSDTETVNNAKNVVFQIPAPRSTDQIMTSIPNSSLTPSPRSPNPSNTPSSPSSSHGRVQLTSSGVYCHQCSIVFASSSTLRAHARQTQHNPHLCKCGKLFSRIDVLDRHIQRFKPITLHPCPHCARYRGAKSFTRGDHLMQHLRGYHNIEPPSPNSDSTNMPSSPTTRRPKKRVPSCPREGCEYHQKKKPMASGGEEDDDGDDDAGKAFATQMEFTRHMREVHNESLYPCTERSCDRLGGKGFFRKKDWVKHRRDCHSI